MEESGNRLFYLAGKDYVLIVDYFVLQMNSKAADATVAKLKSIFARHGIPNAVVGDKVPSASWTFQEFAKE